MRPHCCKHRVALRPYTAPSGKRLPRRHQGFRTIPRRRLVAELPPAAAAIDGRSLKAFLSGEGAARREWAFSFIADRRILRTKRWLLEDNSPLHYGRLYDCGTSRDGTGYREVIVAALDFLYWGLL